ncbi:glutamyl-tRNA reductase [Nakamurella flavida]|uniref:Glutamyl-tRNA reductase n=1 Tax=Nakamurella flavida TaxID=363630 RepID=A0A939C5P4_9ACTN|nr:glutamyl-tRNA reductase [Nakamurella flavida]MBM9477119.1 glutamyl-tRNA reductase [Nakamurella flavida]MDP9780065.1 glutamyl-tRNA reductase [Nakamurella flavida]
MLMVLGASHHDLELTHLERLTTGGDLLDRAVLELVRSGSDTSLDAPVLGAVVVATCNRLEIYLEARRFHDAIDAVAAAVATAAGIEPDEATALLKVRVGAPVAAHLFSVVSGLDSMVVGEAEIAGQVGRAFRTAQLAGTTTTLLNALFQSAARTAKQVTSTTSLGAAGRSIASVALDVAEERFRVPATALVVGTGAYARVVAAELRTRGCQDLQVFSPSGRADSFAARHHAVPVGQDALVDVLAKVDMVVTCSGGSGDALAAETLREAVARRDTSLPIVDLALRPDVSEPARAVPGVQVIDLRTVSERVDPMHAGQLTAAQDIVIAAVAAFEEEQVVRRLDPAVVALRRHVTAAVEKELTRLRGKYDDAVAADVELAMHRVTQSLLHTPTLRAKELARTGEGAGYVQALHTLFGIEVPADQDAHTH